MSDGIESEMPQVVTFFVPVPEPLSLPPEMTVTFEEDEDLKIRADLPRWLTPDIPADPHVRVDKNFVSLKVWQGVSAMVELQEQLRLSADLASTVTGLAKNEDAEPARFESALTIVEAVTALLPGDDAVESAFGKCLDRLSQLVTAYGLAARQSIAPPARSKLPMLIYYAIRRADAVTFDEVSVLHLHDNDVLRHQPAPLKNVEHVKHFVSELEVGGPRVAYMQLSAEARRFYDREGDARIAVIMAETACEVLLDALLGCVLWEEEVSPQDAAETLFGGSLAGRIKRHYASRLRGNWTLSGPGPVGSWYTELAALRNRCVHAGHVPTTVEALAASRAERALLEFVMGRLKARAATYPRSATIFGAIHPVDMAERQEAITAYGQWSAAMTVARTSRGD